MPEFHMKDYANRTLEKLAEGGLFLISGHDKPNIMTIGWSSVGIMWGKPIFTAPVRYSRYTHEILEWLEEFTICVPKDGMDKELAFCGTRSGRDVDKIKELGLTPLPSKKISVPSIKECAIVYECRVLYQANMLPENLDHSEESTWYKDDNYHTFFYGEILDCYER